MEIINSTRMLAGYTLATEQSARECLVVVVKGTFRIPTESGTTLQLHEEQAPLVMSDVYFGEPGFSAPKYEADFSLRKPRCDVLLNGTAYASSGRRVERIMVGMRVGGWSKSFAVVGNRFWYSAAGARATDPEPFTEMPIDYGHAFGGADLRHENPAEHAAFMPNPSGRGFHKHLDSKWLDGSPLPNTEESNAQVTDPTGSYRPMSFGPVGRNWDPRYKFAGTYDQQWIDEVFPFLPADFDEQYFQCAPLDQQFPKPIGEQPVTLLNLTPDGRRDFVLPSFEAPIHIFTRDGKREDLVAPLDTVVLEPDLERATLVWRVARPLRRNIFEIADVLVGRKGREWWQDREKPGFSIRIVVERTQ